MLFKKCFKLLEQLKKELGGDLIFSLALTETEYVLTASVHKSNKWKFSHGKNMQQCLFTKDDLNLKVDKIAKILVTKFKQILVPRPPEENIQEALDELKFGGHAGDPPNISPGSDF